MNIKQHKIERPLHDQLNRLLRSGGFAQLQLMKFVHQNLFQAAADYFVVIGNQDACHTSSQNFVSLAALGTHKVTSVPAPGNESKSIFPLSKVARSFMPTNPSERGFPRASELMPLPLSLTCKTSWSSSC